jgi:hypothetical protein
MRILLPLCFVHTFLCHTADPFAAAMQQLPTEVQKHIFRYVTFFDTQRKKVYNKTIKLDKLVGTIQLACALENYGFLAAVEMRRFFHKPDLIGTCTKDTGLLVDLLPPEKYTIKRNKLMETITIAPLSYTPHYPLKLSSTLAVAPALRYYDDQKPILRLAYDNQTQQPSLIVHIEKSTAVVSLSAVGAPTVYGHPIAAAYKTMQCGSWAWPLFITTEDGDTVTLTFDDTTRSIRISPEIITDELLAAAQTQSSQLVYNKKWYCYEIPRDIHPDHYMLDLPENDFHGGYDSNRIGSMWDVQCDTIYTVIGHSHTGVDIKIHDLKPYRATNGSHRLLLASIMGFCNIDHTGEAEKREFTNNVLITATRKIVRNALAKHLVGDIERINTDKAKCIQNPTLKKVIDWCFNSSTSKEYVNEKPHMPITVTWVNEPDE